MPQEVIDRVNQLGKADGQPELLTFTDRKGNLIGDDVVPDAQTAGVDLDAPIAGVPPPPAAPLPIPTVQDGAPDDTTGVDDEANAPPLPQIDEQVTLQDDNAEMVPPEPQSQDEIAQDTQDQEIEVETVFDEEPDPEPPRRSTRE
jgi:hypothetical protein